MDEREFVDKFMHDKAFKKQVAASVMGCEGDENPEHGMGDWMAASAASMGYDLDPEVLEREVTAQIETLSGFQKISFLGSFINAGRKAKKNS